MNKTVKALLFLTFAYAFALTVAFSTFLQIPIFKDQTLMWQSVFEQFFTWVPALLGYYILFKAISANPKRDKLIIDEGKFLLPTILLVFLSGISGGIHICAQLIEDALRDFHFTFIYRLSYFLDEYPGHLHLIFLVLIGFFLVMIELNRKSKHLSSVDNILLVATALINGFMWTVSGIEGGSMYLIVIPLALGFTFYLGKTIRRYELDINRLPYTKYFLIATILMIAFSVMWIVRHGFFTQPSNLGVELFRF